MKGMGNIQHVERNKQANKGNEEGRRERESGGGVHHEAKFETKGEKKKDLVGRERNKEEKQRSSPRGKVEAEKARPMEETKVEAKGREKDVTKEVKIVYMITEPL